MANQELERYIEEGLKAGHSREDIVKALRESGWPESDIEASFAAPVKAAPGRLPRVFVVEDEKPLSRALELKLSGSGFEVKTAYDGEAALKVLETEKFDLIILDLILPKKDGFAVLSQLKAQNDKTPVIVLSNLGQEEDVSRAKKLGAKDYFVKMDTTISSIIDYAKKVLN